MVVTDMLPVMVQLDTAVTVEVDILVQDMREKEVEKVMVLEVMKAQDMSIALVQSFMEEIVIPVM